MKDNLKSFYDKELDKDVKELLEKIECAGSYFSNGSFTCNDQIEMPTIEVKKVCTLKYPVPEDQVNSIIKVCSQAPHGKGTETVIDTSVRKVWQLAPKSLKITNMDKVLAAILPTICLELGLGSQEKVKANLYKLLVYDKGSFFLPHKDTEKEEKMFGTLVISLPCNHKGGDLIIRHSGGETTISMDGEVNDKTIRYCGFYADCEHEVKEITEGNRICLVYNLCRTGRSLFPPSIDVSSIVRSKQVIPQIESGLIKHFESNSDNLFVLLEHQYPAANFNTKKLKGRDIVMTNFFNLISKQISCKVYLGILEVTEEGMLYSDNARDRDIPKTLLGEETSDTLDHSVNYSISCGGIIDLNGTPQPHGLRVKSVLGGLEGTKSTKKMVTETTGNEGSTYEKLYHRAVIVLSPTKPYTPIKPIIVPSPDTTQQTTTTTTTSTADNNSTAQQQQTTTTTTSVTPVIVEQNKLEEPIKVEQPPQQPTISTADNNSTAQQQPQTTTTTTSATPVIVEQIKVEEPIKVETSQPQQTENKLESTKIGPSQAQQLQNKVEDTTKVEPIIENKVEEAIKVENQQQQQQQQQLPDIQMEETTKVEPTIENKVEKLTKVEQPPQENKTEETMKIEQSQSENVESDQPLKKQKVE